MIENWLLSLEVIWIFVSNLRWVWFFKSIYPCNRIPGNLVDYDSVLYYKVEVRIAIFLEMSRYFDLLLEIKLDLLLFSWSWKDFLWEMKSRE